MDDTVGLVMNGLTTATAPRSLAARTVPSGECLADPLLGLLNQTTKLIETLSDEQYARRDLGVVDGSVGVHVRHCLDHVRAFTRAMESGKLDYDRRERGTSIETDRSAAQHAICELCAIVGTLKPADLDRPLRLTTLFSPGLPPVEVLTSFGRELSFVVNHTIHHNALIRVFASSMGVRLPSDFGYAPATIVHRMQADS